MAFACERRPSSRRDALLPMRAGTFPGDRSRAMVGACWATWLLFLVGARTMFDFSAIFQALFAGISDLIVQLISGWFGGLLG